MQSKISRPVSTDNVLSINELLISNTSLAKQSATHKTTTDNLHSDIPRFNGRGSRRMQAIQENPSQSTLVARSPDFQSRCLTLPINNRPISSHYTVLSSLDLRPQISFTNDNYIHSKATQISIADSQKTNTGTHKATRKASQETIHNQRKVPKERKHKHQRQSSRGFLVSMPQSGDSHIT